MKISTTALAKYRYMADGDDARDMAIDYDLDLDAQYDDYLTECAIDGVTPKER